MADARIIWKKVCAGRVDIFAGSRTDDFDVTKVATVNVGGTYPSIEHVTGDADLSIHERGDFHAEQIPVSADMVVDWLDLIAPAFAKMPQQPGTEAGYWLRAANNMVAHSATIAAADNGALFVRVGDTTPDTADWLLNDIPFRPLAGAYLTIPFDARMLLPAGAKFDVVDAHEADVDMLDRMAMDATAQLLRHYCSVAVEHGAHREALAEKRDKEEANAFQHELMRFGAIFSSAKYQSNQFDDALLNVLAFLGPYAGYTLPESASRLTVGNIGDLGRRFGFATRPVQISADTVSTAPTPLLAYRSAAKTPVAIYGNALGSACVYDPETKQAKPLDAETLATLDSKAYALNATLPDTSVSLRQFLSFGLTVCRKDLTMLWLAGTASAVLGMAIPFSIGIIFSEIVPAGLTANLFQLVVALLMVAIIVFVLDRTASLASLRIEGRVSGQVTAALWDRLLRFRGSFFGHHGAGDIVQRLSVAERLHASVQSMFSSLAIKGQHYLVSLVVMALYYPGLAALMVLFSFIIFGFSTLTVFLQRKAVTQGAKIQGSVYNLSTELISGLSKIKAAGAERWAFNRWAYNFTELRRRSMWSRTVKNVFGAFISSIQTFALVIVFLIIAGMGDTGQNDNAGGYLAFMTALATFLASTTGLAQIFTRVSPLIGQSIRVSPFLETEPESEAGKMSPGQLDGSLALDHIQFRYLPDGPEILKGINLSVHPGEFVAIVGTSGSGKSTLLKILLGSLEPDTGSVLFNGKDRRTLYADELRAQVAAVMQAGQVMPGSLLDNIRGNSSCTLEQAWAAATMAGLADDIKVMPMGMQTQITQGDASFSGGQLQRLMIARAIAANPKILVLDEATSALDEPTQHKVMQHLETLSVTRVVVAHRLSTVKQADRIYVLDKGKIVENGTFEELTSLNGKFSTLYASGSD